MNASRTMAAIVVVGVLLGLSGSARATWIEQDKLTASDRATDDWFGRSVSISANYVIAGALHEGGLSGSAYIFERSGDTWTQQPKLTPSDPAAGDKFGGSVSIDGDHAVVGASGDNVAAGSAYIFQPTGSTWTQQAKLTASDGAPGGAFGISVSISGSYALVGASYDDVAGPNSGSAYIFKGDGSGSWDPVQKLLPGDAEWITCESCQHQLNIPAQQAYTR